MEERQALLISIGVLVAAVILISGGLVYSYKQLGVIEEENAELAKKIADAADKEKKSVQLKEDLTELRKNLVTYERILPDEKEIENIMDLLNDFKKAAGVDILSMRPRTVRMAGGAGRANYQHHPYDLSVRGTYFGFMRFINLLETHRRFIKVDKFSVKVRDSELQVPISDFSLSISTYTFKASAKPAATGRARR